jgi:TolB-like protein/Flp pilus assembly protein TadD
MSFLGELKRRNVIRVATAYVVAAWLIIQVVETIFPAFGFGSLAVRVTVIVLAATFIPVLALSWVFDFTAQGLRRESELPDAGASRRHSTHRLDRITLALLALALVYFAFDKFVLEPARDHQKIEAARRAAQSEAMAPSLADPSIAVLPFANLSVDPQQEYFSDGITEELLNLLARVPGLRVISRTSAFSFKGRSMKIGDIARELNVRYVLEGSVRRAGDQVRVTTQLIEAASDRHVWSESYERPLENIFAIQDEIAESILPAIEYQLTGRPPTTIRTDPAAYSLHLQAVHFYLQRTSAGLDRAVEYVQRAIDIDPNYAPSWTLLGSALINQVNLAKRPREEGYRLATEAIERAVSLAPDYALAHSARAWVAMSHERDYAKAAEHFRQARALAPNSGIVLGNNAVLAVILGRLEEAREFTERGIELDPVNSVGYANRADQFIRLGQPVQAELAARKALELSPGMSHAQGNLALAQLLQEDPAAALASAQAVENDTARQFLLALGHYAAGDWAAADEALASLEQQHAHDAAYFIATTYAFRGDTEAAFDWLNRAIETEQSVFGIRTEPFLRALQSDARWQGVLEKVGLADGLIDEIVL